MGLIIFFVNIGPNLAKEIPNTSISMNNFLQPRQQCSMAFVPTNSFEISSLIKSMDNNTAPGIDNVPTFVLKAANSFISIPLASLINSAIQFGHFPDKLKIANVTPIFKVDDK